METYLDLLPLPDEARRPAIYKGHASPAKYFQPTLEPVVRLRSPKLYEGLRRGNLSCVLPRCWDRLTQTAPK
jgi:hypothetical protein